MSRKYKGSLDPDYPRVPLDIALRRLLDWCEGHPDQHMVPSAVADVVWPGRRFRSNQGAGRAGAGVVARLERLGFVEKAVVFGQIRYRFRPVARLD